MIFGGDWRDNFEREEAQKRTELRLMRENKTWVELQQERLSLPTPTHPQISYLESDYDKIVLIHYGIRPTGDSYAR